ncbi:MAG: DNA primase, partial [Patescibacteria group bacterium]
CPFHHEKTPSFYVSPAREIWHCFGCSLGGDVFEFIKQIEGVEFPEALEILAAKAGVILKKEDPRLVSERRRLLSLAEDAAKFFTLELKKRPDALNYLKNRGLKAETAALFRLGYAPAEWRALTAYLAARGYREEEMERAGIAIRKESGEIYDRFRGRIMFPIWDGAARIIGFSGRIFDPAADENGGKYINTPQTALYDKSRALYLWDRAKNAIRKKEACILVEGQMDAVMSHQAGHENAVAVSGTALGRTHLETIKRLTSKLLFAFDTDSAGEMATKRGVDLALEFGFDVNIIGMPAGKDPADAVKENPELWTRAVEGAKPIIAFFLEALRKKHAADFRSMRSEAAAKVLPYIAAIENSVEKAHWVQEAARALALKEDPLWEEVKKISAGRKQAASEDETPPPLAGPEVKTRRDLLEERILGMLAWKREELKEKFGADAHTFFSEHHQPLLECVMKSEATADLPAEAFSPSEVLTEEGAKAGTASLKTNLEKLALEAELLYGEMPARNASRSEAGGERVHEEFHTLLHELEREHIKGKLEALAEDIRKHEAAGEEADLLASLTEFNVLSKRLNR